MPQLNPTERFLLECVIADSENDLQNTLATLGQKTSNIDWPQVAKTIPYIYLKAKNFPTDFKIPKETQDEIHQRYTWHIAHNEKIKYEIAKLAKEFDKAGVDLIFLKGAALLTTVYDDRKDLRTMGDIDVLVRKKDLWKAEEILKNRGYKTKETEEEREILLREHFHFMYSKEGIILELHWDIGEQWHWDIVKQKDLYKDILFGSSRKVAVKDTAIRTLSPAGNIFMACFNFERALFVNHRIIYSPFVYLSKHKKERNKLIYHSFRFFYEIKKMLRYYGTEIKWDELFSLANLTKKEYEIFTLLFLSEKIAKADIPEIALKKMRKNTFVRLCRSVCRHLSYDNLTTLFFLNRTIYRAMLIWSYVRNRKFYSLGMRIIGGRI